MDRKSLEESIDKIKSLLNDNCVLAAISQYVGMLTMFPHLWRLREKVAGIETEYSYLTKYAIEGIEDPSRTEIYESVKKRLSELTDELKRGVLGKDCGNLYYSTLRFEDSRPGETIGTILKNYEECVKLEDQRSAENERARLFRRVWVTFPLSSEEKEILLMAMGKDDRELSHLVIYSLFLGLTEFYDERKIDLLSEVYASGKNEEERLIALVCLLISLWLYRDKTKSEIVLERLKSTDGAVSDIETVMTALLKAGDTERITKKMNEDIIPMLTKMRPDIERKLRDMKNLDAENELSEFNPEWENMFDKAGFSEKMRELTELQSEGNDLMMVTFSHLKTFPFFNEISNWFLPFETKHSSLGNNESFEAFFNLLERVKFFCESDKYSMALSMSNVPKAQLSMISEQMKMQSAELDEIMKTDLDSERINRNLTVTKTVQNIYRFFKLFRRKSEFRDPFNGFILLSEIPSLGNFIGEMRYRKATADFLFSKGYYKDAVTLYEWMADNGANEMEIYQKSAYCNQKLGNIEKALKYYEICDLIDSENCWNLKRLGFCSRLLGRTDKALKYFDRILEKKPDDVSAILNAGQCNMELENYAEAVKLFYKAEFLDNQSLRTLRPLAWCLIVSGDYDKAWKYYGKIEKEGANSEDYLNMGHLAMIGKNYQQAIGYYSRANNDAETFDKEFAKDIPILRNSGVDDVLIAIVKENIENS